MIEVHGNIWDHYERGAWIVITTNGTVRKDGCAVLGRGVALQATVRMPDLPRKLGLAIQSSGNMVHPFYRRKLMCFPVKHEWWEKADLKLIAQGVKRLTAYVNLWKIPEIYVPRLGCGNGKLQWEEVKPLVEHLDDRFKFITL